jgi:hypothetical protein
MSTPPSLHSAKLGPLVPHLPDDEPEALGLKAVWNLPVEGDFDVVLPETDGLHSPQEWQELVAKLDQDFEALMTTVPKIRQTISEDILQHIKESFEPTQPLETPADLAKDQRMSLTEVIYFPTGEVRLIYQIDTLDPDFGRVDYCVDLTADREIADAYFDG